MSTEAQGIVREKNIFAISRGLAALTAGAALVFALGGYLAYRHETRRIHNEKFAELKAIAELKSAGLVAWRQERLADAATFSLNPINESRVRAFLENSAPQGDQRDIRDWLESLLKTYGYMDVVLVDRQYRARLSVGTSDPGIGPFARGHIEALLRSPRPLLTDIHNSVNVGRLHCDLYAPLLGKADARGARKCLGVLLFRIDPELFLYPYIRSWPSPSLTSETLLVRRDGDSALFLNKLRHRPEPPMTLRLPLSRTEVPAVQAVLGRTGQFKGFDYRGVKVVADVRAIPDMPWFIVSKVDAEEILSDLHYRGWVILILVLLGTLIAGGLAVLLHSVREWKLYRDLARSRRELDESHVRLKKLSDQVPGVVYQYRLYPDGRSCFPYASQGITEIYEVTPEEVREDATAVFGRLHPDDLASAAAAIQESARTLGLFHLEFRVVLPRQGLRWRLCDARPERLPDGGTLWYGIISDITERVQIQAEHERLTKAIEQAGEIVIITNIAGNIQYVNPAFETVTGYHRQEIIGKNPRILKSGKHDKAHYQGLWETISSGRTWANRLVNKRKDGTFYTEEAVISPVKDAAGKIVNYVGVTKDITEQLRLEGQFYQAQKMEAVGLLAGGIAHDFNNILTAIKGYCGMVTSALKPEDPNREDMNEIMSAADRASTLTRQLLAFSRRQIIDPKVTDLNKTFNDMTKMLGRIIGEGVKLSTKFCSAPCLALVDPGLIEQAAMNLVVNARDAVGNDGKITLETEVLLPPDEFFSARPAFARGRVACVKVGDNGLGMSPEVKKHLFEPFYTTKAKGKGTGLGLSMVYGTVKQSGGDIVVESEPGKGTVFKLYFPLAAEGTGETSGGKIPAGPKKGTETVLFVEDDDSLRRLGERQLRAGGYTVIAAADGKEALEAAQRHGKPVDLLITDVIMPGMSGRELAAELVSRKLVSRTLFMSGYTDDSIVKHGVLEPGIAFMYKPFTAEALSAKIREALDGPADRARA